MSEYKPLAKHRNLYSIELSMWLDPLFQSSYMYICKLKIIVCGSEKETINLALSRNLQVVCALSNFTRDKESP